MLSVVSRVLRWAVGGGRGTLVNISTDRLPKRAIPGTPHSICKSTQYSLKQPISSYYIHRSHEDKNRARHHVMSEHVIRTLRHRTGVPQNSRGPGTTSSEKRQYRHRPAYKSFLGRRYDQPRTGLHQTSSGFKSLLLDGGGVGGTILCADEAVAEQKRSSSTVLKLSPFLLR